MEGAEQPQPSGPPMGQEQASYEAQMKSLAEVKKRRKE